MVKLIHCLGYLAVLGILSFIIGRILPKKWFDWNEIPFKTLPVEKGGKIYERLHIRKWKDIVPDMSKIVPALIPKRAPKTLHGSKEETELLLQETCIAEFIHGALCVAGVGYLYIWPGVPGVIVFLLYVLGNLPFMIIQRYNRPRLCRIYQRLGKETPEMKPAAKCEGETA